MRFQWIVEFDDKKAVEEFMALHQHCPFVKNENENNVIGKKEEISRNRFWGHLVVCLLTTSSASGAGQSCQQIHFGSAIPIQPLGLPEALEKRDSEEVRF